jgi:ubiquinone/menaquinone biosynthesis C-methylase UbiE
MTHDPDSVQQRITSFWSKAANDYDAHPGNVAVPGSEEYAAWVEAFRGAFPPPPSDVLDVGTGTGFVARIAIDLGHKVTAIDLSQEMLAVARTRSAERAMAIRFLTGDAVAPPFPPESFDVIVSRHLLWTLREPETAFAHWRRLLRPGGRVVATHAFWSWEEDMAARAAEHEPNVFEQHYTKKTRAALPGMQVKTTDEWLEMLRAAGFVNASAAPLEAVHASNPDEPLSYLVLAFRS